MHYYKRDIGDYAIKAARLSMLQHGAYNLLLDACYKREQFPTREEAIEWSWASSQAEIEAIDFVLNKFFTQKEDGKFVQKRIHEVITEFRANSETNRRIAIERESKRRELHTVRDGASRSNHEPPPNYELPIKNYELPIKNEKKKRVPRTPLSTDSEWIASLSSLYPHVNVDQELRKMDAWLSLRPERKKTRSFIIKWLNRIEAPMEITKKPAQTDIWENATLITP